MAVAWSEERNNFNYHQLAHHPSMYQSHSVWLEWQNNSSSVWSFDRARIAITQRRHSSAAHISQFLYMFSGERAQCVSAELWLTIPIQSILPQGRAHGEHQGLTTGALCVWHTHTHAYRRCAGSLWLVVLFGHKGKKNIGFHIRVTKQHAKPQLFSFLNCKKRLAYVTHTCSTVVHTGLWPLAKSIECCTIKEANQGYSHSREETLPAITASFIHIIFDTWILKIGPM